MSKSVVECFHCSRRSVPLLQPAARLRPAVNLSPSSRSSWSHHPTTTRTLSTRQDEDPVYGHPEVPAPPPPRRRITSTITPRERLAFDRLFKAVAASPALPGVRPSPKVENHAVAPDSVRGKGVGEGILSKDSSASTRQEKGFDQGHVEDRDMTDLMRYPKPLRAAAAQAIYEAKTSPRRHASLPTPVLDRKQQKAFDRVVTLIQTAKTDRELWTVLDENLFSIFRHQEEHGRDATAGKKRRSKKSDARQADPAKSTAEDDVAKARALLGPSYPHLVLLAMRVFRNDFRLPSACLALFAHLQALGPVSHVMGATTPLYNEMIGLKWKSYADFHAIDELLAEMDKRGVEFDEETLSLLEEIETERATVATGDLGAVTRSLWDTHMLQEGLQRIEAWKGVVEERLIEKASRTGGTGRKIRY